MKNYLVSYKHTFGSDIFKTDKDIKYVINQAVKSIREKDFSDVSDEELNKELTKGIKGMNYKKEYIAYKLEDFIEEIAIVEFEEDSDDFSFYKIVYESEV